MEDKPKEIIELERALGIDHVDYYKWDGENVTELTILKQGLKDITPLSKLNYLEKLDLSFNEITDLSPLSGLKGLNTLNLRSNKIFNIIQIPDLMFLSELDLSENQISDISSLGKLINLRLLNLFQNQITHIDVIKNLKKIEILYLSRNKISNISPLINQKNINTLGLGENKIIDITPLKNMLSLKRLDLGHNQIDDISIISKLSNLQFLDLSFNNISDGFPLNKLLEKGFELSTEMVYKSISKIIRINGNPIANLVWDISFEDNGKIKEFFTRLKKEKKKGTRPINEAKMIIIGEPDSGKTTLMNYLQDIPFTVPSTTQGFTIGRWIVEENQTNYRINIWDFGGQDIQSTVHQFFLTQDTLYLMVLNARKDELPDKYIEQIKSYAPDSPIIIIVNRIEENPSYEMGINKLKALHIDKKGNSLIKGVFKVSLLKGLRDLDPSYFPMLEEMKQAIEKVLLGIDHIRRPVPITYLDVKAYLESAFFADKPYISHDTYEVICREKGLDIQSDGDLLGYLNNLGTVRYFEDLGLRNLQILNPEWLSDGVYRILVDKLTKQLRGIITEKDFETILQKTEEHQFEYPKQHYNYLIQMIRKFDIGYYDEETKKIFIPRAFGLDYLQSFDASIYKSEAIHFFFRYESFIPSTIMPAFITKMFGLVMDQLYSQDGVVLEQNAQFALVEQTPIKNRIDIWVSGDKSKGEYFEFFLEIRKVFREFHAKRPGLVVDEMIGLGKNSDVSVKYNQLIANKINGVNDYIGEDGKKYNIDELLGRFENKNNTIQYITEQNNYHVGGDMYSGNIYMLKHNSSELISLLKQNRSNFTEDKRAEIDKIIFDLEIVQTTPIDKISSKSLWQQLNETRKNIAKISSEEAVKWFTKSALDGKFNETIMNAANKVLQGLHNPMLRDFVDNGSNMM